MVWISGIALWKGLLLGGTLRMPNCQAKLPICSNLHISWGSTVLFCCNWHLFINHETRISVMNQADSMVRVTDGFCDPTAYPKKKDKILVMVMVGILIKISNSSPMKNSPILLGYCLLSGAFAVSFWECIHVHPDPWGNDPIWLHLTNVFQKMSWSHQLLVVSFWI